MKNRILIIIVLFLNICSVRVFSQSYSFWKSTSIYAGLQNPVLLSSNTPWNYNDYTIPIGFNFPFFNSIIDTLYLLPDNGGVAALTSSNQLLTGSTQAIIPFGAPLIDRGYGTSISKSPISYEVIGISPERIFKMEWKNCGFFFDWEDDGLSTDFVNFQVWLYEGGGQIELHYGPAIIKQPLLAYNYETGPEVAIIPAYYIEPDTFASTSLFLTGFASNPNMIMTGNVTLLNGSIPTNTIFNFRNIYLGLYLPVPVDINIYPNPFSDKFYLEQPQQNGGYDLIEIFDMNGRKLFYKELNYSEQNKIMEIAPYLSTNGLYVLKVWSKGKFSAKRIMKCK